MEGTGWAEIPRTSNARGVRRDTPHFPRAGRARNLCLTGPLYFAGLREPNFANKDGVDRRQKSCTYTLSFAKLGPSVLQNDVASACKEMFLLPCKVNKTTNPKPSSPCARGGPVVLEGPQRFIGGGDFRIPNCHEMVLELVWGAGFWCNRHCRTTPVVLEGFWGQVWPQIGRKPTKN